MKLIKNDWYQKLIQELKELEFSGIVLTKHAIGKRILEDFEKFGSPEYGNKRVENIAKDLDAGADDIYRCIQFAKKCPEISDTVRELSWRKIIREVLPDPRVKTENQKIKEVKLQKELKEKGKYNCILADPPWKYDVDLSSGATRSPENNYPVMDLEDLKKFGETVKNISHKNCILFMWITAPKLNWMNDVLEAWGFEYKTNFIWDKIKPNMGHYSSVRHEILIIAGKGVCSPTCDGKTIQSIDSVQSIEKSARHSEKPHEFYKIIETLYPTGKKIELFARNKRIGWNNWGNQI